MKDTRKRIILKSISYRIWGTIITMLIVFLFTGRLDFSLGAGVLEVLFKTLMYYLHERAWNKTKWGKPAPRK